MDQSTEKQWEWFKCLKMNRKWTQICITCFEQRDDEGEVESEHESGSDETKVDETKGVPEEKAEGDHEKGEGEEQVAKIEEPVAEPAAGPSLSRKRRLARKARHNHKKFNLEEEFKKHCSASGSGLKAGPIFLLPLGPGLAYIVHQEAGQGDVQYPARKLYI
ncbi:hypothetical protein DAPPUDRAFT_251331 [Daphnia pulex]|uniref:RanBP2-type domain-containing protein n=1 Tax=Daphnia pulex TaxID=6669 RepID=E9H064_DAPPU|nr:hypothetical protein DAPPUDRAFT_251331 [Daphnia pulex]|eukprot:EFX74866.1 hypothetical protein DAPPUDRAFT_251331 [Daphnia pulex]